MSVEKTPWKRLLGFATMLEHADLNPQTTHNNGGCPQHEAGSIWVWLKIKREGQTAGFGFPGVHLPIGQPILGVPVFWATQRSF